MMEPPTPVAITLHHSLKRPVPTRPDARHFGFVNVSVLRSAREDQTVDLLSTPARPPTRIPPGLAAVAPL